MPSPRFEHVGVAERRHHFFSIGRRSKRVAMLDEHIQLLMENTNSITARCLCKAHTFTASVAASSLPLPAECCHCDSCRHVTGSLYLSSVEWPNPDEDLSGLHCYPFSSNIHQYSCPTCSSQLFSKLKGGNNGASDKLEVFTGVLENAPNLVKYTKHIFVGDTLDAGATIWFSKDVSSGEPIPRWSGREGLSEQLPPDWPAPSSSGAKTPEEPHPEFTPLRCHCGGVNLLLRSAVDIPQVPARDTDSPNPKLPWYIDPETHRYRANTDCCDSCRLTFGTDLVHWTFAGLGHISFVSPFPSPSSNSFPPGSFPATITELKTAVLANPNSAAQEKDTHRDLGIGTLALFQSSPDVERYFCRRCAASVFFAVHDTDRMDMVDIAVGLLRHPDGARAEGLLSWKYGSVGWIEDVKGGWREALVKGAVEGSEAWRVRGQIGTGTSGGDDKE
ncbi:hypothetical protein N656DRAFT_829823 [Canariomyces notabilis]|uniref:CENP-V/GFA domain-containing protein n=1 Tax=Canariomyces notabilis TaxID=2074819 RepID=A0AAN6YQI4_9PEZI|nr:hypothetical protein N656DRAFT_829823 [Canariomyces arenarius]